MNRIALWLFLGALMVRLGVLVAWPFDGLYGQDAFAYYRQATALAQGTLPLDFFWPNGYPLVAALFMPALGQTPFAAQLVSLLSGASLAPLAYLLTCELLPHTHRRAGILAGLIVMTAGQLVLSSIVVMADMLALFWAALAAWLLVRAWRNGRPAGWLVGAGAALAFAAITRWLYVLLAPAFGLYLVYQMRRQPYPWWLIALPVISGLAVLLPQIAISLNRPEGLLHSWLLGWNPANAFRRQFDNVDGHFDYALPIGLFYAEPAAHPAYLFPLLGLAALWGGWRLWGDKAWGPLILLGGWGGGVYLFLAGIPYQNFRFGMTLYLPLVVLAASGLNAVWENASTRRVAQAAAVVSLAGMLVWAYSTNGEFVIAQNRGKAIVAQVEQSVPPDATLITFGLTLTARQYTRLNVVELFDQDSASLDALTRSESAIYLLLDPGNVESQWRGRKPDVLYQWLKQHAAVIPIDSFATYELFQVRRTSVP